MGTSFQFFCDQGLNASAMPQEDIAEPKSFEKMAENRPIRRNPAYKYLLEGFFILFKLEIIH